MTSAAAPDTIPDAAAPASAFADPGARLTTAFRAAAARMAGLAFVNPALEVEAVAFAPWQGHWLGVMVTPWFMNLTLLPRDAAAWRTLAPGAKRRYRFPAGEYEFVGANDPVAGEMQVCSLFSPVLEFDDHPTARLVAMLAREALFDSAHAEAHAMPVADLSPGTVCGRQPGSPTPLRERVDAPLSKRDFLRGRFAGDRREDRG